MKKLVEFDAFVGNVRGMVRVNPDRVSSLFSADSDKEHTWIYLNTEGLGTEYERKAYKVKMAIDLVENKLARGTGA